MLEHGGSGSGGFLDQSPSNKPDNRRDQITDPYRGEAQNPQDSEDGAPHQCQSGGSSHIVRTSGGSQRHGAHKSNSRPDDDLPRRVIPLS